MLDPTIKSCLKMNVDNMLVLLLGRILVAETAVRYSTLAACAMTAASMSGAAKAAKAV
jgi:hypothetical protein